jgi:tetratricopeptide (TPR) repeat protein/tRNA A-37 threonylcarbamoyl transferase component Bud32
MLRCSDIAKMARLGEAPTCPEDRAAYRSHLESCPSCRCLLDSSGPEIPATIFGEPAETLAPAFSGSPSPTVDAGQDPYGTVLPTEEDAYATRLGAGVTVFGEADRPRSFGGRTTEPQAWVDQADPSWPLVPGYELLAKLGEGGMGVVYKARQRRLNRLVALKMIRGDGRAGEVQLNRFRIEAEAVARVRHPNIVQIYEIGDVAGFPYFSLELLEGGGLDSKLAGTPRPAREAAEMVRSLCLAIEAAHEARIIHRDLKPANVVLAADGTPKVTDFGLAKRLEEEESQTRTGDVMGSPSYMSPEQAKGQGHLVGPASDIYSLGAILYEMLTGRPPFRGPSAWDTVRQVVEEEPVPPTRLQPRVPRDLETIALKCLDKEPARRYPTARAMGEDLHRFLANEPILARPIPFWERGLKWVKRRPATAALSTVAAAAMVAIVGGSIWYAQLVRDRARVEADDRSRFVFAGRERLFKGREQFARDLGAAEALFAELQRSVAEQPSSRLADPRVIELDEQVTRELSRTREALRSRKRGADFRATLASFRTLRDDALFLDTSFDGLQQAGVGHDPEAGGRKAEEALELFTKGGVDGSRTLVPIPPEATATERTEVIAGSYGMLLILSEAESRRSTVADPKARAARALRVLDSAPRLATGLAETRAYHIRRIGHLDALGDEAGAALEREALARVGPGDAFDRLLYGVEVYKRGKVAEAIPEFQAARVLAPDLFWARALLAISLVRSGRPAEARIILDECLRDRPNFAWLYLLRGYASGQLGLIGNRRDASSGRIGAFAAFDDGPPRPQGPREPSAAPADSDAAEEDFRRALDRLGPGDSDLRYTLHLDRGFVRLWQNRLAEAADDFEQAIRLDPARFNAYVNLAGVRLRQDDLDGAIDRLTEALERTPDAPSKAGALRLRALIHERKSARFGSWADREAAIGRAFRQVDARLDGISLAPVWSAATCRGIEARERQAALDDYSAIPHEPGDRPEEVASDLVGRARLLLKGGRAAEAMDAADLAMKADPRSVEANRLRIGALLERGLYARAIAACDTCLADRPSADLFAIRGKARARTEDLAGAIRDFDRSLDLRPDQPQILIDRGWLHLFYGYPHGAPQLALDDFEKATRLAPDGAEAFCGRGNARAALELDELAVRDADRIRCARIYAIAADSATSKVRDRSVAPGSPRVYTARAVALIRGAILDQPPDRRDSYFRRLILPDEAFRSIRRDSRLAAVLRDVSVTAPARPSAGP